MITGNRVNKFSTATERLALYDRLDKLTLSQRNAVVAKHQGFSSVHVEDLKYWAKLEEYIIFYENAQVSMFPIVTDAVSGILENITPKELDKIL
jgi:hypothetical protein